MVEALQAALEQCSRSSRAEPATIALPAAVENKATAAERGDGGGARRRYWHSSFNARSNESGRTSSSNEAEEAAVAEMLGRDT